MPAVRGQRDSIPQAVIEPTLLGGHALERHIQGRLHLLGLLATIAQ